MTFSVHLCRSGIAWNLRQFEHRLIQNSESWGSSLFHSRIRLSSFESVCRCAGFFREGVAPVSTISGRGTWGSGLLDLGPKCVSHFRDLRFGDGCWLEVARGRAQAS